MTLVRERALALVVAGLLAGAVLANLADLPRLEHPEQEGRRAFLQAGSADFAELGFEESPNVRQRRGLYLRLAQHAPYATLLVGPYFEPRPWQVHGLGRVEEVITLPSDPTELIADIDIGPFVVADDEEGNYGPWPFAIAVAGTDAEILVVRLIDDRWEFIDLRLVPGEVREDLLP